MAEVVGTLLITAFTAATDIAVPTSFLGANVASTVGSAAILAGAVGLGYALAPKPPKAADGNASIKQAIPPRQGGYGRARVAGSYMLYEAFGSTSLDVLALISGRVCAFRQWYLNDDVIGFIAGGDGHTVICTNDNRYRDGTTPASFLYWRFGFPTETAYSDIVSILPSIWTTSHRGDGIASVELKCFQASDIKNQNAVYPNGLPSPSVACDLYPIWDPRDVAQDPDDPDTWVAYPLYDATVTYAEGDRVIYASPTPSIASAYSVGTTYDRYAVVSYNGADWVSRVAGNIGHTPGSDLTKWLPIGTPYISLVDDNHGNTPDQKPAFWVTPIANPVLQIIDLLTNASHGMQLNRDILITPRLSDLIVEANLCDELVADKNGSLLPRYTSNGKFNFDDAPTDVLLGILASCDGWMTEDGEGSLTLKVGVYRAPTVTFTDENIISFTIEYGIPDEQVVNELTLSFIDPNSNYKEVAGQPWQDTADISSRGLKRSQTFGLSWVQTHSQGRRLSKRAMARLSAKHGTIVLSLYGILGLGQRWVRIQYPIISQTADIVVELSRGDIDLVNGTITFDWMMIDPDTIDAWDPVTEEGDGPALTPLAVPPMLDFNLFSDSSYLGII